jgi:hypothetical protein
MGESIMTGTLRYWIEQSEHECGKPLPIGSCFKCDMLQLERERNELTEALGYILGIGLTQKTKAKAEKALRIND